MARIERNPDFLDRIERFRLLDDTFMSVVFDDKECAEFLIRKILDDQSLSVVSVTAQKEMKNLNGRSIRLDIHAIDSNGKAYDIEVERSDSRATPKRARYNASIMDSYITEPGDDYEKLPESYVIFVTENDVWKGNLPIYTADRCIKELGNVSFGDESHILFVNTAYKGESRLDSLFHDFRCTDPDNMKNEILADRVRYFKESDEGVDSMCQIMEELRDKSFAQGEARGAKKEKKQLIMQLLKNMSISEVAKNLNMSVEDVEKIVNSED